MKFILIHNRNAPKIAGKGGERNVVFVISNRLRFSAKNSHTKSPNFRSSQRNSTNSIVFQ